MKYKPGLEQAIERLSALFLDRSMDRICAVMRPPNAALVQFRREHSEGFCDYPNPRERVAFWDAFFRDRARIEDDSVPAAYLSEFDQGLYGAVLGAEPRFLCDLDTGWISSMVAPLLDGWGGLDDLRLDPASEWFQRYLRQLDVFVRGAENKFAISHFILIDSLNFCFELRGATQTYADLMDHPSEIRKAVELAYQVNVWIQDTFFDRVGLLRGGTCSNMVQWMPGRIVSESVDPFHMTSVDYFYEWGVAPIERMFAHYYDGGVLHLHGNGRHLLEGVCTIQGLKAILTADDRGYPRAFETRSELRRRAEGMPLVMYAPYAAFQAALEEHSLPGGILYDVTDVPDVDVANRCMERVRAYRA